MQWWEELAEARDEGHEAGRIEGHEVGRLEGQMEGRLEGQKSGELHKLISQVIKKLKKGKEIDVIAEELEENIEYIKKICDVAGIFAPEYDLENIVSKVKEL